MKNLIRAAVVAMVVTGAFASTHTVSATKATVAPRAGFMPIPGCPWNDPNACGMGGQSGK